MVGAQIKLTLPVMCSDIRHLSNLVISCDKYLSGLIMINRSNHQSKLLLDL